MKAKLLLNPGELAYYFLVQVGIKKHSYTGISSTSMRNIGILVDPPPRIIVISPNFRPKFWRVSKLQRTVFEKLFWRCVFLKL